MRMSACQWELVGSPDGQRPLKWRNGGIKWIWQSKFREPESAHCLPTAVSSLPFSAITILFGSLLSLGSESYFRVNPHSAILHRKHSQPLRGGKEFHLAAHPFANSVCQASSALGSQRSPSGEFWRLCWLGGRWWWLLFLLCICVVCLLVLPSVVIREYRPGCQVVNNSYHLLDSYPVSGSMLGFNIHHL